MIPLSCKRASLVASVVVVAFATFLLAVPSSVAQSGQQLLSVTYVGDENCEICHEKVVVVRAFVADHPEVDYVEHMLDFNVPANWQFVQDFYSGLGLPISVPGVVLNRSGEVSLLTGDEITAVNLEAWLAGGGTGGGDGSTDAGVTPWVAFVAGLVVGVSACMLLLLSVVGTSLASVESRAKYAGVAAGLVGGLAVAYLVLAALFVWLLSAVALLDAFKYGFAAVLLALGAWQLVDFRREKSAVFGTPGRVKSALKSFVEMRAPWASFVVGFVFAFVKVPCFGGPFLAILFDARDDPLLFFLVGIYYAGMLLPIVALLVAQGAGLRSDRVDRFRSKYRPHLRLASGLVLIVVTIYLLLA
ncbi:MAG: hypothetical protein Kow0069_14490 [Promethearchaeota archaeon]